MLLGMITKIDEIAKILHYAKENETLSVEKILLGSSCIPKCYRSKVALQLDLQSKILNKMPSWAGYKTFIPERINLEQSSSEQTAIYKSRYVKDDDVIADLTSGLGVDLFYMLQKAKKGIYIDYSSNLIEAAKYNYKALSDKVYNKCVFFESKFSDVIEHIVTTYKPTLIYLDPARRSNTDTHKRVYAIEDCSPNIIDVIPSINELYIKIDIQLPRYIVKLSPMLDINHVIKNVKHIYRIEIIADKGEVKELLLHIDSNNASQNPIVYAINMLKVDKWHELLSSLYDEQILPDISITKEKQYIYEPNAAILKSQLFKTLAVKFELSTYSKNCHIFFSDKFIEDFYGRVMQLVEVIPYSNSKEHLRRISLKYPRAQIRTRDFVISSDSLRKKLNIRDGDDFRIIGTKDNDGNKVLLVCKLMN